MFEYVRYALSMFDFAVGADSIVALFALFALLNWIGNILVELIYMFHYFMIG